LFYGRALWVAQSVALQSARVYKVALKSLYVSVAVMQGPSRVHYVRVQGRVPMARSES